MDSESLLSEEAPRWEEPAEGFPEVRVPWGEQARST